MMNKVATVHQHILLSFSLGTPKFAFRGRCPFPQTKHCTFTEELHAFAGGWCALTMLLDLFRNHKIAASRRGDSGRVLLFCYKITVLLTVGIFEAVKDTGR